MCGLIMCLKTNPNVTTTQIKKQNLGSTSKAPVLSPPSPLAYNGNYVLAYFIVSMYLQTPWFSALNFMVNEVLQYEYLHDGLLLLTYLWNLSRIWLDCSYSLFIFLFHNLPLYKYTYRLFIHFTLNVHLDISSLRQKQIILLRTHFYLSAGSYVHMLQFYLVLGVEVLRASMCLYFTL